MPSPTHPQEFKIPGNSYIKQHFNGVVYHEDLPGGAYREITRTKFTTRIPGTEFKPRHPLHFTHSHEENTRTVGVPYTAIQPTPAWADVIDDFPRDEDAPPLAADDPAADGAGATVPAAPAALPATARAATPAAAAAPIAPAALPATARAATPAAAAAPIAPAALPATARAATPAPAAPPAHARAITRAAAPIAPAAPPAPAPRIHAHPHPEMMSAPGSSIDTPIMVMDNSPDRRVDDRTGTRRGVWRSDMIIFSAGTVLWILPGHGTDPAAIRTVHCPMQRQIAQNGADINRRQAEARARQAAEDASKFFHQEQPEPNPTASSSAGPSASRNITGGSASAGPSTATATAAALGKRKRTGA